MKQSREIKSLNDTYENEHFVEFYQDEDGLLENLRRFVGGGIANGDPCIVIATSDHTEILKELLIQSKVNVDKIHFLDARETLEKFMKDSLPDKRLFNETVGGLLSKSGAKGKSIRAFGEMVALLWAEGNHAGAVLLEQLWNDISRDHKLTLFCAYPAHHFESKAHSTMLEGLSNLHSSSLVPKAVPQV